MTRPLLPMLALVGFLLTTHSASAVTAADAPGYMQTPICLMGNCDQVQATRDAGASASSIQNAGLGQGGRLAPGQSRPISMKLPNGGYQCYTIRNNCGGEIFIPANSSGEWGSFLNSSCVSTSPCTYGRVNGPWDPWSASCGPASHSRWIACQRAQDGRYVDSSFCGIPGIETETTCFSCPQTTCTTNADASQTCVTDDQCGTRTVINVPPPPPPPPTVATVRAMCADGGERLCEANGPEGPGHWVGGQVTDNLTYACVRNGYKYSYGGWGFRHAQCDSCVWYSGRQIGPDRTVASSWQPYASNHGCDSCGPYVQSYCGNSPPETVDATCPGSTMVVANAVAYEFVREAHGWWGTPDPSLVSCFAYGNTWWPTNNPDQATGLCRQVPVTATVPPARWGQYVLLQQGCYMIGSACTPDGWRSEVNLLYGNVWGADPRVDLTYTCQDPNAPTGGDH